MRYTDYYSEYCREENSGSYKSDRELESTCWRAQITKWLYNDNKCFIVDYFKLCLVKFSVIDEESHEGPNLVSGKP